MEIPRIQLLEEIIKFRSRVAVASTKSVFEYADIKVVQFVWQIYIVDVDNNKFEDWHGVSHGLPSEDVILKLRETMSVLAFCKDNAERVNRALRSACQQSCVENGNTIVNSLSFMELKKLFMENVKKTTSFQEFFIDEPHRRKVSKLLHDFINERNIYTHGLLCINKQDASFIISAQDRKTKEDQYYSLSTGNLESFLHAAVFLISVLNKFSSDVVNKVLSTTGKSSEKN